MIESRIRELGYSFWWKILSPHKYGTCQIRSRVYIVCIRNDLAGEFEFTFPKEQHHDLDIRTGLDDHVDEKYNMTEDEIHWVEMWDDFLKNVNTDTKLPGHPIWSDCFKGNEELPGELEQYTKAQLLDIANLWRRYGWSKPVKTRMRKDEIINCINLPEWKQDFIRKNRLLYSQNRKFIERGLVKWAVCLGPASSFGRCGGGEPKEGRRAILGQSPPSQCQI